MSILQPYANHPDIDWEKQRGKLHLAQRLSSFISSAGHQQSTASSPLTDLSRTPSPVPHYKPNEHFEQAGLKEVGTGTGGRKLYSIPDTALGHDDFHWQILEDPKDVADMLRGHANPVRAIIPGWPSC